MRAWEYAKELIQKSKPRVLSEEEQTWNMMEVFEIREDERLKMLWYSRVPGSGAEERLVIGAV